MASEFVTPEGRVSFPAIFEPRAAQQGQEPKYQITLLLPKDSPEVQAFMSKLQAGVQAKIAEKWPNAEKRPKTFRFAIKDGDTAVFESGANSGMLRKEKYPEMAGHWTIDARSKKKPPLVDVRGNEIINPSEFYAGCWARVGLNLFAYQNVTVGVGAGLQTVMKTRDDTPFGGVSRPEDDFAAFIQAGGADTAPSGVAPADVQQESVDSMFS